VSEGGSTEPQVSPTGEVSARRRVTAYRAFYAACGAVAVSITLPWVSVAGIINASPSGGEIFWLLLFAAAYGYAGYRVKAERDTHAMLIGAWVLDAVLGFMVIAVFSAISNQGAGIATPGGGVFLAGIGVIAGIVGTVNLRRVRRARVPIASAPAVESPTDRPPPGSQISPDGFYWLDERTGTWRLMPQRGSDLAQPGRCPNGHVVQAGDAFCEECGAPLTTVIAKDLAEQYPSAGGLGSSTPPRTSGPEERVREIPGAEMPAAEIVERAQREGERIGAESEARSGLTAPSDKPRALPGAVPAPRPAYPQTPGAPAAPEQAASPPADWYPDPKGEGRLRYWDGEAWTEHTAA
jgi:hypothetical protein